MNEENQFECEEYVGGGEEWDEKKTYTLHSGAVGPAPWVIIGVEGHWVYDLIFNPACPADNVSRISKVMHCLN